MRRSPALALLSLLALGPLAACSSPCRELSEKLCECQETTPDRQSCEREVARAEGALDRLDSGQEQACEELLTTCNCEQVERAELVDSATGKVNCGMARDFARAPAASFAPAAPASR